MSRIELGRVSVRPGDALGGGESGGLPSLQLITSVTATNSSEISSGSLETSAPNFIGWKVFLTGIQTATRCEVFARTSSDGINYAASGGAYSHTGIGNDSTSTGIFTRLGTSATGMALTLTAEGLLGGGSATTGGNLSAEILIFNINATSTTAFPEFVVESVLEGTADICGYMGYGRRKEIIPQYGVLISASSIIKSGRMDVYGIRAA